MTHTLYAHINKRKKNLCLKENRKMQTLWDSQRMFPLGPLF
jgi:hypothetical protein